MMLAAMLAVTVASAADTLSVRSFRHAGPFPVARPYMTDSLDVNGKPFKLEALLEGGYDAALLKGAPKVGSIASCGKDAIHLLGFSVENRSYAKTSIDIKGLKNYKLYVDGKEQAAGELKLEPATHEFAIKLLTSEAVDSVCVNLSCAREGILSLREDGRHIYSLDVNTQGTGCAASSISCSGKYATISSYSVDSEGKSSTMTEVVELPGGRTILRSSERLAWMPDRDECWYTRKALNGKDLICLDPMSGKETIIARNIPEGYFTIAPDASFLIYTLSKEGPKEGDVHRIVSPEDRQPGWRDRSYIAKYDIASGIMQPLTFGWHNTWPADISTDGRYLLFSSSRQRLTARPTSLSSYYRMDLSTMEVECLVEDDGFLGSAQFSPDGSKVLFMGSPEALDRIGMDLPEGRIPNAFDYQLYVMDIETKAVTPLTKEFAPSVQDCSWSKADGRIYLSAEDKDCKSLFRIDPVSGAIEKMDAKEDNVSSFELADSAPMMIYHGQSLCNADRCYLVDTRKGTPAVLRDFSAARLADTSVGEGGAYEFISSRGDLINGFYVLPPDFDPSRKYPLIVHYYGGCSPSTRYMVGSYSPHIYSAQGYVFYVVNPSSASGFGQEFASRHVNTAGEGVADDIIEATRMFCHDHEFVDSTRIGCFSASYGGFMTQLLLSKTDLYRTGISHAGISDHTSYWGEGYWGYSYSEVSMADSYPWTRKDLYVDRSPLYNADKIHTPLLFLHGSADTNVPIGESIQMFTALRLLGEDTAFVVVDGENHGIRDYAKRRQWLRTIFAWFAKYLKDDPTWWDEMYPAGNLE